MPFNSKNRDILVIFAIFGCRRVNGDEMNEMDGDRRRLGPYLRTETAISSRASYEHLLRFLVTLENERRNVKTQQS